MREEGEKRVDKGEGLGFDGLTEAQGSPMLDCVGLRLMWLITKGYSVSYFSRIFCTFCKTTTFFFFFTLFYFSDLILNNQIDSDIIRVTFWLDNAFRDDSESATSVVFPLSCTTYTHYTSSCFQLVNISMYVNSLLNPSTLNVVALCSYINSSKSSLIS